MPKNNKKLALIRASRVRYKLRSKAAGKIRLTVFRSSRNMYVQAIDDKNGVTVAYASTMEKGFDGLNRSNIQSAQKIGTIVAQRLLDKNIKDVVFDKGPYLYHGKIKALADAARDVGLKF